MTEKEFMIASLRKQRDLLNDLMLQLAQKDELEKGSRTLYDHVTKHVERNLKELRKFKTSFSARNTALYPYLFESKSKKQNIDE